MGKYKEFILIDVHIYDFAFMSTFSLIFCTFDINIAASAIFLTRLFAKIVMKSKHKAVS